MTRESNTDTRDDQPTRRQAMHSVPRHLDDDMREHVVSVTVIVPHVFAKTERAAAAVHKVIL